MITARCFFSLFALVYRPLPTKSKEKWNDGALTFSKRAWVQDSRSVHHLACRQRNFSHWTCTNCWNQYNRTKNIFWSVHIWSSNISTFKIFLQRNQTDFFLTSHGAYTAIRNVLQIAAPQLDRAKEKTDISIILKTRITGLQISFCLRRLFAALKVEIKF